MGGSLYRRPAGVYAAVARGVTPLPAIYSRFYVQVQWSKYYEGHQTKRALSPVTNAHGRRKHSNFGTLTNETTTDEVDRVVLVFHGQGVRMSASCV